MIRIQIHKDENIERALKRFKRKFNMTKVTEELRNRKEFKKPSEIRRNQIKKAIYIQKIKDKEEKLNR